VTGWVHSEFCVMIGGLSPPGDPENLLPSAAMLGRWQCFITFISMARHWGCFNPGDCVVCFAIILLSWFGGCALLKASRRVGWPIAGFAADRVGFPMRWSEYGGMSMAKALGILQHIWILRAPCAFGHIFSGFNFWA